MRTSFRQKISRFFHIPQCRIGKQAGEEDTSQHAIIKVDVWEMVIHNLWRKLWISIGIAPPSGEE
jgi:hypothetical protein